MSEQALAKRIAQMEAENDAAMEAMARAMNLEAGRQRGLTFEDDWHKLTEQERGGWRLCARAAAKALAAHMRTEPNSS